MDESTALFWGIKGLLGQYASRGYTVTEDSLSTYTLVSKKEVEIAGRKHPQVYFASVRKGRSGTVFHYFPVYVESPLFSQLDAGMKKCLKGKCCFHFRRFDPEVEGWVRDALEHADAMYRKLGWVNEPS